MKIVLDERDQRFIDGINKDLESGECPPLFVNKLNRKYYIEFECNDIAKANAFVYYLMNHNNHEMSESLGIDIKAIHYSNPDSKIAKIQDFLRNMIDELDKL